MTLSALMLSACQTPMQNPTPTNQTGQIIDMPVVAVNIDSDGDGVPDDLDMCPDTQQNAVVDARGCHITTGPGMGLQMEIRVFFAKGSSEISPQYYSQLDNVGKKIFEVDTATMRVEGNISEDEISNSTLSKSRAIIVKNYLIMQHKIAPERITTFDCAANSQIAPNDTQEGRAMNRRVYGLVTQPDEEVYNNYQKYSQSDQCVEF